MNFDELFDDHETFGQFTVTIDAEYNRADVWLNEIGVNIEYVIADAFTGEPEEDAIVEAIYNSGYRNQIIAWVENHELY